MQIDMLHNRKDTVETEMHFRGKFKVEGTLNYDVLGFCNRQEMLLKGMVGVRGVKMV